MSAKQLVLDAIHRLPEDIDLQDIAEEIAFLAAIREAQQQIKEGKVISNDEMKRRIDSSNRGRSFIMSITATR